MARVSVLRLKRCCMVLALCLLSACSLPIQKPLFSDVPAANAQQTGEVAQPAQAAYRAGRFALIIDTEPQQSFLSSFDLTGGLPDGVLTIYNPLGMQMAKVEWTAQSARLLQGSQVRQFENLEKLIYQTTGTQLPAAALVDWLSGKPTPAEGWNIDVSEWHLRRLVLERVQPAPRTVLRIAFES
jgi:outer membrane lipoprotein LolB